MLQRNEVKGFLCGLIGMLFLISAAVMLTLSCKSLYKADMKRLDLAQETGYSEEEILENYKELIAYNISPLHKELKFPTFPMSEEAGIHFKEVKVIFQGFFWMMILSGIAFFMIAAFQIRKKDWKFLKYTGICSLVIPCITGALVAWNWEWVFVTFHELVFANDYWLFDPVTDPVILVLPDEYFMHCAVMIIGLVQTGAAVCLALYAGKVRKKE